MAVSAPIASASVVTKTATSPGVFPRLRIAYLRSCSMRLLPPLRNRADVGGLTRARKVWCRREADDSVAEGGMVLTTHGQNPTPADPARRLQGARRSNQAGRSVRGPLPASAGAAGTLTRTWLVSRTRANAIAARAYRPRAIRIVVRNPNASESSALPTPPIVVKRPFMLHAHATTPRG